MDTNTMRCDAGYKTQGNLQKPSNAMRRQPGASSTDSTNSKPLPGHGALFKGPDQFGCSHNASVWGTWAFIASCRDPIWIISINKITTVLYFPSVIKNGCPFNSIQLHYPPFVDTIWKSSWPLSTRLVDGIILSLTLRFKSSSKANAFLVHGTSR